MSIDWIRIRDDNAIKIQSMWRARREREWQHLPRDGRWILRSKQTMMSSYNAEYFCVVRLFDEVAGKAIVAFDAHGDMSLGHLQSPSVSTLNGYQPIDVDMYFGEGKHRDRRITGLLTFTLPESTFAAQNSDNEGENQHDVQLLFRFGQSGYEAVDISPLRDLSRVRCQAAAEFSHRMAEHKAFLLEKEESGTDPALSVMLQQHDDSPHELHVFPDAEVHATLDEKIPFGLRVEAVSFGSTVIEPGETFEDWGIEQNSTLLLRIASAEDMEEALLANAWEQLLAQL